MVLWEVILDAAQVVVDAIVSVFEAVLPWLRGAAGGTGEEEEDVIAERGPADAQGGAPTTASDAGVDGSGGGGSDGGGDGGGGGGGDGGGDLDAQTEDTEAITGGGRGPPAMPTWPTCEEVSPKLGFASADNFGINSPIFTPPNTTCRLWEVLPITAKACVVVSVPELPTLVVLVNTFAVAIFVAAIVATFLAYLVLGHLLLGVSHTHGWALPSWVRTVQVSVHFTMVYFGPPAYTRGNRHSGRGNNNNNAGAAANDGSGTVIGDAAAAPESVAAAAAPEAAPPGSNTVADDASGGGGGSGAGAAAGAAVTPANPAAAAAALAAEAVFLAGLTERERIIRQFSSPSPAPASGGGGGGGGEGGGGGGAGAGAAAAAASAQHS